MGKKLEKKYNLNIDYEYRGTYSSVLLFNDFDSALFEIYACDSVRSLAKLARSILKGERFSKAQFESDIYGYELRIEIDGEHAMYETHYYETCDTRAYGWGEYIKGGCSALYIVDQIINVLWDLLLSFGVEGYEEIGSDSFPMQEFEEVLELREGVLDTCTL